MNTTTILTDPDFVDQTLDETFGGCECGVPDVLRLDASPRMQFERLARAVDPLPSSCGRCIRYFESPADPDERLRPIVVDPDAWYLLSDLADVLRTSVYTLRRASREGRLKIGRREGANTYVEGRAVLEYLRGDYPDGRIPVRQYRKTGAYSRRRDG